MGGRGAYSGKSKPSGPLGKKVLNYNQDDPTIEQRKCPTDQILRFS